MSFLKARVAVALNKQDQAAGIENILTFLKKEGLYPKFRPISDGLSQPECIVEGKKYIMFASNNYLGLSEDPEIVHAGTTAIKKYGMGPGGSRVINGDSDIVRELEVAIAELTGTDDCLTFPTGYMANIAVFQALMDPLFYDMPAKSSDSIIFSDQYNHGSIIDGCRLSKARKVVYKHDDLRDLRDKLKQNNTYSNKLIVTEGVFSLDGEIMDLPQYLDLAKEFNARLMVDDAHGIGVIGENGGGTAEYYNCSAKIDILMGCMDKAFGGTGGFLCGTKSTIDYLRIASRSSILSSSLPAGMAGAMLASVKKIKGMKKVRQELIHKAEFVVNELRSLGFKIISRDSIPVVVLHMGKETLGIDFAEGLWREGIFSPVVRWPAVPEGGSRFRILMMKDHTQEHLNKLIGACAKIGRELKIIS